MAKPFETEKEAFDRGRSEAHKSGGSDSTNQYLGRVFNTGVVDESHDKGYDQGIKDNQK